ncbi:mutator type transposase [Tanacetum coccineum]
MDDPPHSRILGALRQAVNTFWAFSKYIIDTSLESILDPFISDGSSDNPFLRFDFDRAIPIYLPLSVTIGKFNDGPKKEYIEGETCFVDYVNRDQFTDVVLNSVINSLGYEMEDEVIVKKKHKVMDVYVEIVEKNEESESGSDSASESDNDFEDEGSHYNMLIEGRYVMELKRCNPDTTVKIDVYGEEDPESPTRLFRRIYVCLGALKKGFREGGRELLGLDGAFMRGQYPGQMLTAVGVDANNGIYPVAYGIVESENQYSWTWFLKCLGDDFDLYSNSNFTFITDRQKGLLPALEKLFPHAEHRYCVRHIYENMNLTWKGSEYKEMLWKCASSTTTVMFEKNMQELKDFNKKAYEWLKQIPAEHWSRAYFSGRAHCDLLINNICEVFNRQLLEARDSPIITALEHVREYLMKRIVVVQKIIEKCDGPLTPAVARVFDIIKEASSECIVDWNGADQYQVKGYLQEQYVVNLNQRTCSCRKWEISGIPCKHAIAAIHDMADNGNDVGIPEDWVHDSYKLATWKAVYSHKVNPVNGRELWSKFDCPTTLLPPKTSYPQIGMTTKKERKNLCHAAGHNKRSCDRRQPSQGGTSNAAGVGTQPSEGETSNAAGVGPLASQGGTSNAAGVGTQASQGGTSNTAGTKRKSKGSTGTSNAAGTQASQASKGGTSNAATQASTGSPLKRTKKSASRLTPEK